MGFTSKKSSLVRFSKLWIYFH